MMLDDIYPLFDYGAKAQAAGIHDLRTCCKQTTKGRDASGAENIACQDYHLHPTKHTMLSIQTL